uniref:Uncharacterized protein n=1 Tax=Candidatus Kentrum sp. TUN TaxID=2126343 RepID=A0A451A3G8_9GAMM|nr:MAG: hypothetical protein BECKTUN1418D_GA0071000_11302 [Candidatus Kentron sp. TUN]
MTRSKEGEKPVTLSTVVVISICSIGFVFIALMILVYALGWIPSTNIDKPGDAISVANTYIVFTTIIFVAATVILVVIGFSFAKQFADSKDLQLEKLFGDILLEIESDDKRGKTLAKTLLENEYVINRIDELLDSKMQSKFRIFMNSATS